MVKKFYSRKLTRFIFLRSFVVIFIFFIFSPANYAFASETQGTIDGTYKYAWGENIGWLNFGCNGCGVSVTDTGLSGHAWSRQYGWINLSPSVSGVLNNAEGTLSGYAWSSNLGWINFSGVAINSSGEFLGYATIKSDNSRINFNCANASSCGSADFRVKTDWRPRNVRSNGGGNSAPAPGAGTGAATTIPASFPAPSETPPISPPISENLISSAANNISRAVNSAYDSFVRLFKPKEKPASGIAETPKTAPLSLKSQWNLLPVKAIESFVFAPLPYEVRVLAAKFPELGATLKNVGVDRLSDMDKLTGVTFKIEGLAELEKTIQAGGIKKLTDIDKLKSVALDIPGLSNMTDEMINSVGAGKISLIKGLPIAKFSLAVKQNLPAEFVFTRTGGELIDLDVALSINDKGGVAQKIASLPSQTLRLVVKPISQARSVTGYFVFKSSAPRITQNEISRSSLAASALFSLNGMVEQVPSNSLSLGEGQGGVEKKLVLSSFEYTDPDNDGIYTADVITPVTPGEYEIITIIDYVDPTLGVRRMSMITVIDPEGYVFEKNNGKETRIPSAIVSLYYLNTAAKKYELWEAKKYSQENPQITDIRGTYSFLVPEGSYYFQVEAPGYRSYEGKVFVVTEGSGVHQNIELKSSRGWLSAFDWKTALLIVVFLLLVYNLFKDRLNKL